MANKRMNRIDDEIKRCVSDIIRTKLRDPRIDSVVSVLRVKTSKDLEHCLVYVSDLGEKKEELLDALNSASGFIRKLVAEEINLRYTPEFKFILDDSIEYGAKINDLINKLNG